MSRPVSTRHPARERSSAAQVNDESSPAIDPAERLKRWAALVAVGEAPLPEDIDPAELKIVLAEVAQLRRDRLVRLVARAIVYDIHQDREH